MSDDETEDDQAALGRMAGLADLPEGALPVAAFVLVSYINEDGTESFCWGQTGHWTTTDLVGCMTVTSHHLVAMSVADWDEDDT